MTSPHCEETTKIVLHSDISVSGSVIKLIGFIRIELSLILLVSPVKWSYTLHSNLTVNFILLVNLLYLLLTNFLLQFQFILTYMYPFSSYVSFISWINVFLCLILSSMDSCFC